MKTTDVLSLTPERCFHQREQQGWSHHLTESSRCGSPLSVLGDREEGPWRSGYRNKHSVRVPGNKLPFLPRNTARASGARTERQMQV